MIGMLIQLLLVLCAVGALWWGSTLIPLPPPFRAVAGVVFAIVACLVLLHFAMHGHWRLP